MNGWAIAALALLVFEVLVFVGKIGKPRPPITPGQAVGGLVEYGLLATLIVLATVS